MLNFISFGSGSSGNCYYLFTATDGLLIDTGVGLRTLKKEFRDYGLSMSSVNNVLITHDHADHVKSVGCISNDYKLPVYSTRKVHSGILRNYCVQRKVPAEYTRYIEKGVAAEIGEFTVTPFAVPHDSTDNVGYFIENGGVAFCIMTDAGCVTEEMAAYIGRANYLVIEANHDEEMLKNGPYPPYLKSRILSGNGHLSNKSCGEAVAANMTERLHAIWLCHLSEDNNHPELARKTVESILADHGITVGEGLLLEVLKRKTPTGIFELGADSIL